MDDDGEQDERNSFRLGSSSSGGAAAPTDASEPAAPAAKARRPGGGAGGGEGTFSWPSLLQKDGLLVFRCAPGGGLVASCPACMPAGVRLGMALGGGCTCKGQGFPCQAHPLE